MSGKIKNILSKTECASVDTFYAYINDELSKAEIHAFEAHLVDCPFCEEALEGMSSQDKAIYLETLSNINTQLDKKINSGFSISYFAVAASIIVALFIGSFYFLNSSTEKKELSVKTTTEINKDELEPVEIKEEKDINTEEVETNAEAKNEQNSIPIPKPEEPEILDVNNNSIVSNAVEEEMIPPVVLEELVEDEAVELDIEYEEEEIVEKSDSQKDEIVTYSKHDERVINATSISRESIQEVSVSSEELTSKAKRKQNAYYKDESATIDYGKLLSLVNEQINDFSKNNEKEKKVISYDDYEGNEGTVNNNTDEIRNQLDNVQSGEYKKSLKEIEFLLMKDVWTAKESASLKWLKVICLLKTNSSAKSTLKELKKNKSAYQQQAKELYNILY